jgi:hypothetical protein
VVDRSGGRTVCDVSVSRSEPVAGWCAELLPGSRSPVGGIWVFGGGSPPSSPRAIDFPRILVRPRTSSPRRLPAANRHRAEIERSLRHAANVSSCPGHTRWRDVSRIHQSPIASAKPRRGIVSMASEVWGLRACSRACYMPRRVSDDTRMGERRISRGNLMKSQPIKDLVRQMMCSRACGGQDREVDRWSIVAVVGTL